jgi:hypothetical protein
MSTRRRRPGEDADEFGGWLDPCNRYGGQVWQESVKGLLVTWPG